MERINRMTKEERKREGGKMVQGKVCSFDPCTSEWILAVPVFSVAEVEEAAFLPLSLCQEW